MDVDPRRAKIIGRAALAKIGYLRIMRLAREAGWVTRKKRKSARRSDPALLAQAAAASTFVVVFTEYAVAAGVASQADSPAPGPGDVAAIGILVVGLIDAGLLEGAILATLGGLAGAVANSTTSAPPVVTTMATTKPTVDAPPVPITRTESADEKKERCKKVKHRCIEFCTEAILDQGMHEPMFSRCVKQCMDDANCA